MSHGHLPLRLQNDPQALPDQNQGNQRGRNFDQQVPNPNVHEEATSLHLMQTGEPLETTGIRPNHRGPRNDLTSPQHNLLIRYREIPAAHASIPGNNHRSVCNPN